MCNIFNFTIYSFSTSQCLLFFRSMNSFPGHCISFFSINVYFYHFIIYPFSTSFPSLQVNEFLSRSLRLTCFSLCTSLPDSGVAYLSSWKDYFHFVWHLFTSLCGRLKCQTSHLLDIRSCVES